MQDITKLCENIQEHTRTYKNIQTTTLDEY